MGLQMFLANQNRMNMPRQTNQFHSRTWVARTESPYEMDYVSPVQCVCVYDNRSACVNLSMGVLSSESKQTTESCNLHPVCRNAQHGHTRNFNSFCCTFCHRAFSFIHFDVISSPRSLVMSSNNIERLIWKPKVYITTHAHVC